MFRPGWERSSVCSHGKFSNYHYCKASLQVAMSQVTLAEIVGLVHALGIDKPHSGDDADAITRELSRRTFWYVFNLDK